MLDMNREKLAEAVRVSLTTLIGIAEKIKEVEPLRVKREPETRPNNILDPDYQRPWWTVLAGLSAGYLAYMLLRQQKDRDDPSSKKQID